MMIFYKNYQYAPIATLVSGLSSVLAVCAVIGGLALFGIRGPKRKVKRISGPRLHMLLCTVRKILRLTTS